MDSTAIFDAVRSVTGAWARQRKAEEREAARLSRRRDALVRSRRMTVREAAWHVLPQAYLKASSNGTLPAHARQIMYAARGEIQRLAGRMLDDQYFTQQLLPDFMNEHPDATAEWDVVFDARGHFHEPHTGRIVPLGTIEVRRHLREVDDAHAARAGGGSAGDGDLPDLRTRPPLRCDPVRREGGLPAAVPGRASRRALRPRDHVDQGAVGHGKPASGRPAVRGARRCRCWSCTTSTSPGSASSARSGAIPGATRSATGSRSSTWVSGWRTSRTAGSRPRMSCYTSDPAANLRENGATAEEIAFLRTPAGRAERVRQRRLRRLDRAQARAAWRGEDRARPGHADARLPPGCRCPLRHLATAERGSRRATPRRRCVRAGRPGCARGGRLRNDSAQSWDDVIQRLAMQRAGADQGNE